MLRQGWAGPLRRVGVVCAVAFFTVGEVPLAAQHPECPLHSVYLRSGRGETPFVGGIAALQSYPSKPITEIAEFHDCQRLVLHGATYGPLVAIFVSYHVDSLLSKTADTALAHRAVVAATIYDYDTRNGARLLLHWANQAAAAAGR